jgi:hypothetical protein
MIQSVRIASAALAAALVMSCSTSETSTSAAAACSGDAVSFWSSTPGQAEIAAADLEYLAGFAACGEFGAYATAAELADYLVAGTNVEAVPAFQLCAQWFTFVLNAYHDRFSCGELAPLFRYGDSPCAFAALANAVRTALGAEDGVGTLVTFLTEANSGVSVCVCEEPTGATGGTGGTGGTGASGSWGE